jgi:hypothetical protein
MDNNNCDAKMELPEFVKVHIWATVNGKNHQLKGRINPFHISSYCGAAIKGDDGVDIPATRVIVGGQDYVVTMTIEEFDEMIDNIDRGLSLK